MELRHVRSFLSLAKTLSFSRTAEIGHLSQPALSLQIQALEEEIWGKLFERDRRKTLLTAAGVAFSKMRRAVDLHNWNRRLGAHGWR
jgi:DNA-binding transcriptional LysR family regulator